MSMTDHLAKKINDLEDDDEEQENSTTPRTFAPPTDSTTTLYRFEFHGETHTLDAEEIERIHKELENDGEDLTLDDVIDFAKELTMEGLPISTNHVRMQSQGW